MFQRPEGQEEVGTAMSSLLSGMSDFYHAVRLDLNQPTKHLADSLGRHDPFRILVVWEDRVRVREQLQLMADQYPERLKDIGMTRAEVRAETNKAFWQR
ncbi:hypothetical protein [Ensifer sp. ENS01]|uniref:DUF1127 domain-containing protein n=1 Tax=Ensifer sp. ENS01 TaxID=2769293 RepID=UPI0013AFA047|nr:hypothetical protein [Ensifer sp. ENS01]MBD9494314.1 hypothetical protein [Ensifer sp. ENS01]